MSEKHNQLDQLMRHQRQIEQEDSDDSEAHEKNVSEIKKLETKLNSRNQQRVKGPYSDDSSDEDAQVSSQPLFKAETTTKPPQNLVDTIQNKIKWKNDKQQQEIEQLLKIGGDSAKDKKIRELAQKMKSLNLTLEKEKTIRRKLEEQLTATMKANEARAKQQQIPSGTLRDEEGGNTSKMLADAEKKVMEMRLKNQTMKNDLNKAMRVIAREIGDNISIEEILSEENSWKGRQQKIQKLKGRVKELEDKLNNNGINVSHMTGFTIQSQQPVSSQQMTVNSLADNRRKEMQNLKVQVQALKGENELLQNKVKSLTSRKLVLENEARESKIEFEKKQKLLREKSENDDKYIILLKQQNEKLKKEERVVTKLVYKTGGGSVDAEEVPALKLSIEKLNVQLQKRQEKIKELNQQLAAALAKASAPTAKVSKKRIQDIEKQTQQFSKELSASEQQALYNNWKENKLKTTNKP